MDLNNYEELLRNTMDSSMDMIQVFKAIRDEHGEIIDFMWILNNKASEKFYGNVIGKSLLTLNPGVIKEGIYDAFKRVVYTGEPSQSVHHYIHEQFNGWFLQSAVKQGDGVATTTKDITEIKRAEEQINTAKESLKATLDRSLYVIQAFQAVRDARGKITDFTWLFTNKQWNQQYGEMTGKSVLSENPGVVETGLFEKFVQVTETGITIDHEQFYSHEQFKDQWFHQTLVKMGDGFVMNTEDITLRKKMELEVQEKQALLLSVLNNTESSIMFLRPVWRNDGYIHDFQYVYTNDQTLRSVEREQLAGKRMTEVFPDLRGSELLKNYAAVVQTGENFKGEVNIDPYGYAVWAQVFAQKFTDGVLVTYFDITERKKTEAEIFRLKDEIAQHAQDKYQALFNSIDEGFSLLELIFDDNGKVIDYWHRDDNPSFMRMTGIKESVNKRMSELVPDLEPEWYEMLEHVYRTGESIRTEYTVQQLGQWYTCYLSRVGSSGSHFIAAIYDDITERKLAEMRQHILLHISDNLAVANSLKDVHTTVTNALREHYDAGWCYYVEWDEGKKAGVVLYDSKRDDLPSLAGTYDVSDVPEFLDLIRSGKILNVSDYEGYELLGPTIRERYVAVGFRSMLVASLVRYGKLISSLVIGDTKIRHWSKNDETLLANVAERTWAAVEKASAEEALRRNQKRTLIQKEAFGAAINGVPITVSLNILTGIVKEELGSNVRIAFYLAYPDGDRLHAIEGAGDMPQTYTGPIDGFPIGRDSFCSGNAIATGRPALTKDILEDPKWQPYRQLAIEHSFRSTSSYPILTPNGKAIGSLALYFPNVHDATEQEFAVADAVVHAAAIILSHHSEAQEKIRVQEALGQSEGKLRNLFNSIDEGFCIFKLQFNDEGKAVDWTYIEANPAFETQTGYTDPVGKSISHFQPDLERSFFERFAEVACTGKSIRFTQYTEATAIWYDVYAQPVGKKGENLVSILFTDITERKREEQQHEFLLSLSDVLRTKLTNTETLQIAALKLLAEHFDVTRAVYYEVEPDEDTLTLTAIFERNAAPIHTQLRLSDFSPALTDEFKSGRTHMVSDTENELGREAYRAIGIRGRLAVPFVKNGQLVTVIGLHSETPRNWSANDVELLEQFAERIYVAVEKAKAEEALRHSQERFKSIANLVPDLLWDSDPDGSTTWYNQRWLEYTGQRFEEAIGWGWVDTIHPDDREGSAKRYREAFEAGKELQQEHRIRRNDGEYRWFMVKLFPQKNKDGKVIKMYGAATDIHDRKETEEQLKNFNVLLEQQISERTLELQESRDQLRSILDTTLVQMSIMEVVRNENGEIFDLEIKALNKELENETGRTDLVGKYYAQEYPGIKENGLFSLIVKTIKTGEPQAMEYFYTADGFQKWFSSMFVKYGDGVVSSNLDITVRKQAEEERFKNYVLLQKTEEVALMGTWDFDLLTNSVIWSDGMYRLFELEKGRKLGPEIYLEYTTEGGRAAAQSVVKHFYNGNTDFEETLEIVIAGKVKVLHIKAAVVRKDTGQAERILGVDLDISAIRHAEEKIRKMEAEQQLEIFRTSLSTLEEERHRISESLHNGIAQILYGIKINMSGLNFEMPKADFDEIKAYTNKLLTEAITENRRISHELMPTTLEEFGLKSAIDDVCRQLTDGTKFHCRITGLHNRMEKYLELAIYRTAQELMTNVVKHAKATECHTIINISLKEISILVRDDGRGMETGKTRKSGIGLASIRSKIKLLNGNMNIDTAPGKGTLIEVIIPQPQKQI